MSIQNQVSSAATLHDATVSTSISKKLQLTSALLLGIVIIYGVGFAQTSAAHNAAHDMRHSQGFPCH